ncbi:5df0002d-3e5c-44f0-9c23-44c537d71d37 [Thermothielavioides terrestris]|jgi:hypothetical protein|uniref:Uncharacterized protein n=2 Tax=Thermothielavioides terrestris TaxID=2587410 RepID=G2QV19_THETT|nr:uncharacterized protein THITE_2110906 [Thermothielavioides terrestris NRRL 8126]AEO64617.1 hypothetical protein THITE_2110906 [Thermothielavioides terrestris NRRL 8126]SPQ26534.1 5df0002d-3e5c-44f0-9c23-44c537d71d37 [Thermothielavioides terrestris]
MVSSIVSTAFASQAEVQGSSHESGGNGGKVDETAGQASSSGVITLIMVIYIFRGHPYDTWDKRHVLAYFTSPDLPDFHETVHTQYKEEERRWVLDRMHREVKWYESRTYLNHVHAGAVKVARGQEMVPVDILAATPVGERPSDWNCQTFLYEGMQELVNRGFQTQEWYDSVTDEMLDKLLDGTLG